MEKCLAAIQMCSTDDVAYNLEQARRFIQQAADAGAKLVVLPENFSFMGSPQNKINHKEVFGYGTVQDFLSHEAKQKSVWIVGGTIPLAVADHNNKVYAATLVFNASGECVARYNKIHLFDVTLPNEEEVHQESQIIYPGQDIIVFDSPLGKCGLAICYDLRFPEFFRAMQEKGAEFIALPSAFTVPTGAAHWEVLIRARAIENQVYMIAAAQTGIHANQRRTYGHSMIVNPWGDVSAALAKETGIVCSDIDLEFLHQLRRKFPVLTHRKASKL